MRGKLWIGLAVGALLVTGAVAIRQRTQAASPFSRTQLHSTWWISPAGDRHEATGDFVVGVAKNPKNDLVAFVNGGHNDHGLIMVEGSTGKKVQSLAIDRTWNGITWSPEGDTLYVSGGSSGKVLVYALDAQNQLEAKAPLTVPDLKKDGLLAGLEVSADGKTLFAVSLAEDSITAISASDGSQIAKHTFEPGYRPYCVRRAPNGLLFVTGYGFGRVESLDAASLERRQTFSPGSHPNDVAFTKDGRVFFSCGNSDTVVSYDLETGDRLENIGVRITAKAPNGATPCGLGLSPDEKKLFVTNSDANSVAVIDISDRLQAQPVGFIPTAWYPTVVTTSRDGNRLLIGSSKGTGTWASKIASSGGNPGDEDGGKYLYIADMFGGVISSLKPPTESELKMMTKTVLDNTPYRDALVSNPVAAPARGSNPIPSRLGDKSPIKHVIYIIKENKTYDMYLGDLTNADGTKRGNGDPKLAVFGESFTPNHHALAREFVTLDSLYCSGEVSGNGHPWSTQAYCTDLGERNWAQTYGGKSKYFTNDRSLVAPKGRIWDACERAGVPWKSYYYTWTTENTRDHMSRKWAEVMDNDGRDYELADVFIEDLHKWEKKGGMPAFSMMALREDHTFGTSPGKPTPVACVASNDLAIGKIVEACSRSPLWKEIAIFIIQDDAQAGPDHVDAHRTTGFVVSPYTHLGKVVSDHYTTVSMLRTLELILGLQPMSTYDASAPVMYNCFMSKPDMTPYRTRPVTRSEERNAKKAPGAAESLTIDFSQPDLLTVKQEVQLNQIIWRSVKGPGVPYPGTTRRGVWDRTGVNLLRKDED